jgi:P27 family predicted phage terminase small subunit
MTPKATKTPRITAPQHLSAASRRWWLAVCREYELELHHIRLLTLAAESWDRCQEARERIAADGPYVEDRWGQLKAHPAIGVERDARLAFARLLRELALDVAPPDDPRPPSITGIRGG